MAQNALKINPGNKFESHFVTFSVPSSNSAVHWRGRNENPIISSFHLDILRVPKLVPHPALQPGTEVGDPSKVKRRFPWARRAGIRPSGDGFRGVSGPRPRGKILESENANGPLSPKVCHIRRRACPKRALQQAGCLGVRHLRRRPHGRIRGRESRQLGKAC